MTTRRYTLDDRLLVFLLTLMFLGVVLGLFVGGALWAVIGA